MIEKHETIGIFNCLGNLRYKIDMESLKKVEDHVLLGKICDYL